jgi:deoxyribodipyrimidine photo-lyase
LASLSDVLQRYRSRLILRQGSSLSTLQALIRTTGARAVFWNRRYEPTVRQRDTTIKTTLRAEGLTVESFNAGLLFEPWEIQTKAGNPFQVFTPFWKTCLARSEPAEPLSPPDRIPAPAQWPESLSLAQLDLEPAVDWTVGIRAAWRPGAQHAVKQFQRFRDQAMHSYAQDRDRPDIIGSSRLSPHLHFGEISPRQVWHTVQDARLMPGQAGKTQGAEAYLRELGWREFAHHVLYHFPHTTHQPLRSQFAAFPWRDESTSLRAWQRGRTGYPLIDAGMRELWTTGWMHNRVRMVVASFLVKHLLLTWQAGAAWFWDTLVDADLANNTLGWQWAAGCGADAAPYFRIFNPITQGEKFDPRGAYVRHWIPELANVPDRWLHKPWEAPPTVLSEASVTLGQTYPLPIIDHRMARERALAAFASLRDRVSAR